MPLTYILGGKEFTLSYQELKNKHIELCELSDEDFLKKLPEALHLACFISYLKELSLDETLSDFGIIHELAHLMHIPEEPLVDLKQIRLLFETSLKLA